MSGPANYQRALELIELASQYIDARSFDAANRLLEQALYEGRLAQPSQLGGYLQYQAIQTQLLLARGNTDAALQQLTQILGKLRRVPRPEREQVLVRCEHVMNYLPHMSQINAAIAGAKQTRDRRQYTAAFTFLRQLDQLVRQHRQLIPRTTIMRITETRKSVVAHLMENDKATIMITIAELRRQGLIRE